MAGTGNRLEELKGQMCKEEGRTVVGAGTWMETGSLEEQVQEVELFGGGPGGGLLYLLRTWFKGRETFIERPTYYNKKIK